MRALIVSVAALLVGTAVPLAAPSALAQNDKVQPQQSAPAAPISDQKLDAAAAAMQQVTTVRRTYQQKIDAASPSDKPRVASEGNAALKKAVTDHGLSIDEYNSILTVAQNDPAIRAKLMQRLKPSQP
ncbi:MAG TPA: DUF4168 domain-containing protein [Stellaceae bacterium]|nr:DUF4168 domain-containing protein [Stellaceae bacterium]